MSIDLRLLSTVAFQGREVTSPRLRGLLALLADEVRTGCSAGLLIEGLWGDALPENPGKALQILVSRARAQLGAEVIVSTPVGYRLGLAEGQVDAAAVVVAAGEAGKAARAGDHRGALAHAEAGLALWAGEAASGPMGSPISGAISGSTGGSVSGSTGGSVSGSTGGPPEGDPLAQLRWHRAGTQRRLVKVRGLALAGLGRHAEAQEVLAELAQQSPRDEEVLAALLRAEAAHQGPSKALTRYEEYRRGLRDELGSEPGAELQEVYRDLLQNEAPQVRHGVLHEPNPLLGRDEDVAAVTGLLRSSRVASVVGPGGLGKTRLAHAVARQTGHRAVYFVELAGVSTDGGVAAEVAAALGAAAAAGSGPLGLAGPADDAARIADALGSGSALLVLDNCEQVTHGVADLVRVLVSRTKDLRVLTTTRTPLGLSSESVYQLPELDLPTTVKLFEQRARAARPDAELPRPVVEELCRHLDGLPLAVELAAARIRVLSLTDIARRLADRFALLRGGSRDAPERHRTLQAVVDWSWNLLAEPDRAALRALSVFPGGFTAEAAARLTTDDWDDDVLDTLERLVDQSLLKVADHPGGVRFRMLESVREFSAARLAEAGETERAVTGFLMWAKEFGRRHHEEVFGAEPRRALDLIEPEQDNLLQAMRSGLERGDGAAVAATTAVLGAMWTVASNLGRIAGAADDTGWFLSHYRPEPDYVDVAVAAATFGTVYSFFVNPAAAARHLVTLKRLPPAAPDTLPRAMAHVFREMVVGGPDFAATVFRLCDSDEPLAAAVANGIASYLLSGQGESEQALAAAHRMLDPLARVAPWYSIVVHSRLAELHLELGDGREALDSMAEIWRAAEQLNTGTDTVGLRWGMVLGNLQTGDLGEAERWLELAAQGQPDAERGTLTYGLGIRAEIQLARGHVDEGLELWRAALGRLGSPETRFFQLEPIPDAAASELVAAAIVAHARHGRLDAVPELVGKLPEYLHQLLPAPDGAAPSVPGSIPVCGALLLALGMVDLHSGDATARRSGTRLVALAERFRFLRGFQPTMRPSTARQEAEEADGPAYSEAVAEYAGLGRESLREAALAVLAARAS